MSKESVDLRVEPITKKKTFKSIPIELKLPEGWRGNLQPSKASVVVAGPHGSIEKVKIDDIKVIADGSGISRTALMGDEVKLKLTTALPAGLKLQSLSPKQTMLRVNVFPEN